jgi:uncharacterized protein (TIGR03086 family)
VTTTLPTSVELLGRALDYTRARLVGVRGGLLDRPTPCAGWRLSDLLEHMEDSLDAFTEAAGGQVAVHLTRTTEGRITAIQEKACALLGVWGRPGPGDVLVGGLDLASPLLVATAALEITAHGWDVGRTLGDPTPVPHELAEALLPVAHLTVTTADRGRRFAPELPVGPDTTAPDWSSAARSFRAFARAGGLRFLLSAPCRPTRPPRPPALSSTARSSTWTSCSAAGCSTPAPEPSPPRSTI